MPKIDLSYYPDIRYAVELTDASVIQALDVDSATRIYAVGSQGDQSAGIQPTTYTPYFGSLDELNAFCGRHVDFLESLEEDKPIPYLDCDHHEAVKQTLDEDGVPIKTMCSKCNKHLDLCPECLDGELPRPDPTCRVCFGRGWVVKKTPPANHSTGPEPIRFRIRNDIGGYRVSIPNYAGGEVVNADYHDMVINVLKQIIDSVRQKRDWLDPDLEKAAKEIIRKRDKQ